MTTVARLAFASALVVLTSSALAKPAKRAPGTPFDKVAAGAALEQVDLGKCRVPTAPRGEGHVKLTFDPSGSVKEAVVDAGPFLATPAVAKCIGEQYKKVKVPAFQGEPVTVGKTFRLR